MSFNHQAFRIYVQSQMLQSHLSLREAAKQSGVSASTLSRIANGETPDMETFTKLVEWLRIDVSPFFSHTPHAVEGEVLLWSTLYTTLEVLNVPQEQLEAIVKIVQGIRK